MAKKTATPLVLVIFALWAAALFGLLGAAASPAQAATPGTWTTTTHPLNTARDLHTATRLADGRVLVAGGYNYGAGGSLNSAELYDPATGTWTTTTHPLNTGRCYHTATLLADGRVLVVGGEGNSSPFYLNSAEIYDPALGTWTTTTHPLNTGLWSHTATLLADGRVLVVGGQGAAGPGAPFSYLYSTEIYDPAKGTWTTIEGLNTGRFNHTATLLADGRVLVAGGQGANGTLNSAEIYDPTFGTWTTIDQPLNEHREYHTATRLANGQVLVAGGWGGGPNTAEIYDPASATWTAAGSFKDGRGFHSANLLANGRVLVAGGALASGPLNSAVIYDPASGTWTTTNPLNNARDAHTATLLANGRVLAVGGDGSSGTLNSAEIYQGPPFYVPLQELLLDN